MCKQYSKKQKLQSFERRWQQQDEIVRRERSRSPLHKPSHDKTRFTDFSYQEDSDQNLKVKMASVVRMLSPGVAQADRHMVVTDHNDATVTVRLDEVEETPAPRASSVD